MIPVRVLFGAGSFALVAVSFVGCGSPDPVDFHTSDRGNAPSGGTGAATGGSGAAPQGGSGGSTPMGGAGGMPSAGSAGVQQAGAGGASGSGGSASGGTGVGGGSTEPIPCGGLECVAGQQYCRNEPSTMSGMASHYMCSPFADSCSALDCTCFCNPPAGAPCGSGSECMCSGEKGRVTVVCTKR